MRFAPFVKVTSILIAVMLLAPQALADKGRGGGTHVGGGQGMRGGAGRVAVHPGVGRGAAHPGGGGHGGGAHGIAGGVPSGGAPRIGGSPRGGSTPPSGNVRAGQPSTPRINNPPMRRPDGAGPQLQARTQGNVGPNRTRQSVGTSDRASVRSDARADRSPSPGSAWRRTSGTERQDNGSKHDGRHDRDDGHNGRGDLKDHFARDHFEHRRHDHDHDHDRDSAFLVSTGFPFFGYGAYSPFWSYSWPYYGAYNLAYGNAGYYDDRPYYAYDSYSSLPTEGVTSRGRRAAVTTNAAAAIDLGQSEFAEQGKAAFRAGDYAAAVRDWRHAIADDPANGMLHLGLAQGLFATHEFDEAAGTVQQAMRLLPQEQWGVVIANYRQLYGSPRYTDHLRYLKQAIRDDPKSPALRFLAGYHYGYLGYPAQAVRELDELVKLAPSDRLGAELRELMAERAQQVTST